MEVTRLAVQWLIFFSVVLSCAIPARTQTVEEDRCADGTLQPPGTCVAHLCRSGWAQSHGYGARCGSAGSNGANSGPSAAESEAEREREAEQARLAEAQRKLAEQQRLDAERRQREHEEWERSVAEAAGSLKGVSTDDTELKGVGGQTDFFGLKGVSPDEAGSMIKTGEPGGPSHSVMGA